MARRKNSKVKSLGVGRNLNLGDSKAKISWLNTGNEMLKRY